MKELWNMGRVVGLSSYEIYLKYIAQEAPNATPATEKEWLCSMLTMGNSMLLRIGTDITEGVHHIDIPLPVNSKICAANTIIGSFFAGDGAVSSEDEDYTGWCIRVTDYGPLIENTSESSPTTGGDIPPTDLSIGDLSDEVKARIPEYLKIIDGIVLQPGTWTVSDIQPPYKDFKPNMASVPTVRISFKDKIEHPFYVLLTGFSNKFLVQGVSATDTALDSNDPSDGDFLGPWTFPWASKIQFSIPPVFADYMKSETIDIATEDLAAMQIYNTKYIWLYRMGAGSTAPTQEDLEDTTSLYQLQGVTGYVSDKFIDDYCVSYTTAKAACETDHISDGYHMQRSMIDQIGAIYGDAVAEENFKFFFWSNLAGQSAPGQQGMFYPVDVRTKAFAFALTNDTLQLQVDHGFNFTTSSTLVEGEPLPPTSTDLLGGLYNRTGADAGKEYDSDGNLIYEDHPTLNEAVKEYATFTRAYVNVPLPPAAYQDQFVEWFSATPVMDIIADNATDAAQVLDVMGVHADYRKLDFQSFLQYGAAQRDLTQPMSDDISEVTINRTFYIYSATDIETIADVSFTWTDPIVSVGMAQATMSSIDYYKPADIHILEATVTYTEDSGVYTYSVVEGDDVTRDYTNSAYHEWAAVATSSTTQTKAISLIDNFGSPLPTAGSAGNLTADVLRWADLLYALNQNKAIDLLGGLINLKYSGSNYVQVGTIRLYISSTEPTGDIPEGSLGIGWGGIKTYTSGAWTTYS